MAEVSLRQPIDAADLGSLGRGLRRPECVLCLANGDLLVSRWAPDGGGITRIRPDGEQRDTIGTGGTGAIGTNGFALLADGDIVLANLHAEGGGGAWRLSPNGDARPFLQTVDGRDLPPANFVGLDRAGRIWITVSTWQEPRAKAYRPDIADGFIVLVDDTGARIVAEGIGYTNEAIVDGGGEWLYVNHTMGRRTTRQRIAANGDLGPFETVAEYGAGVWPDGLAFDEAGGLWITSVVSNRIIHVAPDGAQSLIVEENDPAQLAVVEAAFQAGRLGREQLDSIATEHLKSVSSLAFGGPDRRTAFIGNLLDDKIYTFRSPVAGLAPAHWRFSFGD